MEKISKFNNEKKEKSLVFGDSIHPESNEFPEIPDTLNIFPIESDPEFLAKEALKRDLSRVKKLRFDPVNTCNQACIFCPNNLKVKLARISPYFLNQLLQRISNTCNRISFGCSYEPLMEKNIKEYADVIKSNINDFTYKPKINLVTNGKFIDKRDIGSFVDICDWFHLSIHSCQKDNFQSIEKSDLSSLVSNIKMLRTRYPQLKIHAEMVVTKINFYEADEYIHWAFNELHINSVNMRLVALDRYHPKSYLAQTLKEKISLNVSEENWKNLVNKMSNTYSSTINDVSTTLDNKTPVIELVNNNNVLNWN